MGNLTLTKTRLFAGVWEGVLSFEGKGKFQPEISATHLEQALPEIEVVKTASKKQWTVRVPIPAELIADGVQTFIIKDLRTGDVLNSFALMAGDFLSDDIQVELSLLRDELDMLKSVLRRHCSETK